MAYGLGDTRLNWETTDCLFLFFEEHKQILHTKLLLFKRFVELLTKINKKQYTIISFTENLNPALWYRAILLQVQSFMVEFSHLHWSKSSLQSWVFS